MQDKKRYCDFKITIEIVVIAKIVVPLLWFW